MRSHYLDDKQFNTYAVLAHAQFLRGKLEEAKKNYTFYLEHTKNGIEALKSDFESLKKTDFTNKDFRKIEQFIEAIASKK